MTGSIGPAHRALLGAALLALPSAAVAAAPPADIAIVDVTVIPMSDGIVRLANRTVLLRGDRIVAVGPVGAVRVPKGARRIDGRGRYLLPGLADMHVHLEYFDTPDALKLFLAGGVTFVRSMDGRPNILGWRDRIAARSLAGPLIYTAGPILDGSPPARDDNLALADPASARAAVTAQVAAGYDFIKVYANLSGPVHAAILDEAARRQVRVAGHVPRAVALDLAIDRHWSIEHLGDFAAALSAPAATVPGWARRSLAAPLDPARLKSTAERLARSPAWVVPTTIQADRALAPKASVDTWVRDEMQHVSPAVIARWRGATAWQSRMDSADWKLVDQARRNRLAVVGAMHRAGVRLAIGTDTPNPFVLPGLALHLELANFVEAGMAPLDALRAATILPARMIGGADWGSIARGKRANLVLLAADPLLDIRNSRTIRAVAVNGRWYDGAELTAFTRALR